MKKLRTRIPCVMMKINKNIDEKFDENENKQERGR
jgi:hypothetical protein